MLTDGIVKRLETDDDWKELHRHILNEMSALDSLHGIDFLDKEKAAIEGRSRELARNTLEKILEPFFTKPQEDNNKNHIASKTGVV